MGFLGLNTKIFIFGLLTFISIVGVVYYWIMGEESGAVLCSLMAFVMMMITLFLIYPDYPEKIGNALIGLIIISAPCIFLFYKLDNDIGVFVFGFIFFFSFNIVLLLSLETNYSEKETLPHPTNTIKHEVKYYQKD